MRFLLNFRNVIFLFSILLFSCTHNTPNANEMPEVCFDSEILPIFQTGCAISGCHDNISAEKGLVYSDYNSIMESITAGDANNSKAFKAMTSLLQEPMPPDNPLSIEARTLIRIWIEQGAKNTNCLNDTLITSK